MTATKITASELGQFGRPELEELAIDQQTAYDDIIQVLGRDLKEGVQVKRNKEAWRRMVCDWPGCKRDFNEASVTSCYGRVFWFTLRYHGLIEEEKS